MNRRISIERSVSYEVKRIIAELIQSAVTNLRGDVPEALESALSELDMTRTNIPDLDVNPIEGELLTDTVINELLDAAYMDHFIQYVDIFTLQDALYRIRDLFETGTLEVIRRAGLIDSQVRDLTDMRDNRYGFSDVVHESFNTISNHARSTRLLSVNSQAGIIRLPSSEENHCSQASSDISLSPLSLGYSIVDETSTDLAFDNDPSDPYYITCFGTVPPVNPNYGPVDFSQEDGFIADFTIKFSGVFPITRVQFSPFSSAPVDIIGIYYSDIADPEWGDLELTEIELDSYSTDNTEIELNFDRVFAQEIHVILRQRHFTLARTESHYDSAITTSEYVSEIGDLMANLLDDGLSMYTSTLESLKEIIEGIDAETDRISTRIAPRTRSYVMGVYDVSVSNQSYLNYGEYESHSQVIDGNLVSATIEYDGNIRSVSDTVDTGMLFSILTPDNLEFFLGTPETVDGEDIIDDIGLVEENSTYSNGALVRDTTYPYRIRTHFLPDFNADYGLKLYINGEEVEHSVTTDEIEWGSFTCTIKFTESFAETYSIYEGFVMALRYAVPSYDRYGKPYDPAHVDVIQRIGKPSIADNTATQIDSEYIYHISGDAYVCYAPDEYTPVYVDGFENDVFYSIGNGKGEHETADETVLQIGSNLFISENRILPPYSDFYYGSIKEEPTYSADSIIGSKTYESYATDVSYIKGSLKVYLDDNYETDVVEYTTDASGIILSDDEKKVFYVYNPSDKDVTASYIPLDTSESGTQGKITTNIATHDATERFSRTVQRRLTVSRFMAHDATIIRSPSFKSSNGMFYLKSKFSTVYEPVVVYVNGVKATNVTDYATMQRPEFEKKSRPSDYKYYVESGSTLVFNEDVSGTIIVYYYTGVDAYRLRVRFYRINTYRDDLTPELYNYTLLTKVQRH